MSHTTYGQGKTRIDLNGPYGTTVSLFRIADHWANLCGHDRVSVVLALTERTLTLEDRYKAFANFFGDYATLYHGEGKRVSGDSDPFSGWPFECRRRSHTYVPPTPPSIAALIVPHTSTCGGCIRCNKERAAEYEAWHKEYLEIEDATVDYVIEKYIEWTTRVSFFA
jgi:hypothetical protein